MLTALRRGGLLAGALASALCAYGQNGPYLIKDGASPYHIVVATSASASEQRAAEELQSHFQACTGIELPIVETRPEGNAPMIVLGCGPLAQGLGVDPKAADLGEQGYVMRTVAPHIVIAGTAAAGTMYGVYDFLETHLGVRWYAPGVTKTPRVTELALPQLDRLVTPAFLWRCTSYAWPGKDAEFMARQRGNHGGGGADHPYGIQHAHEGRAHSYFWYVNPSEFFDEHPEYFSEIGGERRREETQLCLTNPDVLEITTERMLERMADGPQYRQHNFSQRDYYSYCECDTCRAMNEKYGTAGGTQFWFVNQLAERTAKVYPDKLIGTLAYMYTEEVPKDLVMHPNVAVWLCHMFPTCDSHPIATCPHDANYKRRAVKWSKVCSHLYIWHYCVDFAHYYNPFPNFRAMAEDMRFYKEIGVEGIYLQAMGSGGGGGEFSLLRPYYGMKLLWDPYQDADAIMRDFLEGYYGAAWAPIYQYIKLLQAKVDDDNIHMHLYTNPAQGYLTDEVMEQSMALFDQAEAAVKDDKDLLERVRVCRMPLTYARVFPRNGYTIDTGVLKWEGAFASLTECNEMYERMKRHGFGTLREMQGPPEQLTQFAVLFGSPMVMPAIANEHLTVETAPYLGGRVLRIIDKASGQCVTGYNITRNLFFPFCGGEETRIGSFFRPVGMFERYAVTDRSDSSMSMEVEMGGFKVRRTLTLVPDAPVLNVKAEFTNATDKPRQLIMRSHTNFDLGDLQKTRLVFTSRAAERVERAMAPIVANLREGEHYRRENVPDGAWTFSGTKGIEVTQRFDEAQLDFAWVYAFPAYLGDLEIELWAKETTVEPGATSAFTCSFEVGPMPK